MLLPCTVKLRLKFVIYSQQINRTGEERHANQASNIIIYGLPFHSCTDFLCNKNSSFFMHFTMSKKCCEGRYEFSSEAYSESRQKSKI